MVGNDIIIRDAVDADLNGILEIYNEAILNTTAVYDEEPHTLAMRLEWFNQKIDNGHPVFVAVMAGKVVGFSSYGMFRNWACYRYTAEISVYVDIAHRGRGLGKLLISPLIETAAATNIHALIAGIDADNVASVKLHQSFGFTEVAHFKQVGYKFNRWLDLKFLELILVS
jgi:L-amino acid N-acyltransferase YncA